jgi:endonuclease/exonuclease/phosphatase family metal-dependent hydrolase
MNSIMNFRIGTYNVLASCLADNLKPWFWYGFAGLGEGVYRNDGFDGTRRRLFGSGRSRTWINFWTLSKRFFKVYHSDFSYKMHDTSKYSNDCPSQEWISIKHSALVDFFNRNNTSTEGNKDLPYHLFSKTTKEYALWSAVAGECGIYISDQQWDLLEVQRETIQEVQDNPAALTAAIDSFNLIVKQCIVSNLRQNPPNFQFESKVPSNNDVETDDELFSRHLLKLSELVALSDADLNSIIAVQKDLEWKSRAPVLAQQMLEANVHVWAVQELDQMQSLSAALSPRFQLAAYKQRSVKPREDGPAIYFDTNVFELVELPTSTDFDSKASSALPISFALFSGESAVAGNEGVRTPIMYPRLGPVFLALSERQTLQDGKYSQPELLEESSCYTFTSHLRPQDKQYFDERVAVFAALRHRASGRIAVFSSVHLHHTQNDPYYSSIRSFQVEQLVAALNAFRTRFGLLNVPCFLLGDFNEAPSTEWYQSVNLTDSSTLARLQLRADEQKLTAMYRRMSDFCVDAFAGHPSGAFPTSMTLSRGFPIDYVWLHRPVSLSASSVTAKNSANLSGSNVSSEKNNSDGSITSKPRGNTNSSERKMDPENLLIHPVLLKTRGERDFYTNVFLVHRTSASSSFHSHSNYCRSKLESILYYFLSRVVQQVVFSKSVLRAVCFITLLSLISLIFFIFLIVL